jgi:hypothetical protein
MKKATHTHEAKKLGQIPNVSPSTIKDLELLGIKSPGDLSKKDPYQMYDALCNLTGTRRDPAVIDTFISAVRFMDGGPSMPASAFTDERKRQMSSRAKRQ